MKNPLPSRRMSARELVPRGVPPVAPVPLALPAGPEAPKRMNSECTSTTASLYIQYSSSGQRHSHFSMQQSFLQHLGSLQHGLQLTSLDEDEHNLRGIYHQKENNF